MAHIALTNKEPSTPEPKNRLLDIFLPCGPLAAPVFVALSSLLFLGLSRSLLTFTYRDRFATTEGIWRLFPIGIRMDLILISFALALPSVLLLLLPSRYIEKGRRGFLLWFTIFASLVAYMEIATFPFVEEYDVRPDQKFLEYLGHVREVGTTLIKSYALPLLIGAAVLVSTAIAHWRSTRYLMTHSPQWSTRKKILIFPFAAALIFLGARSSIGHRPANLSTASFSQNHLANEFALNSTYSMLYAGYRMFRHEKNPSLEYGQMPRDEVLTRVLRRSVNLPQSDSQSASPIPFLHTQRSPFVRTRPSNIVIILQESMGAVDVGCLKGPPITPRLCQLKDEGLWISRLAATGTRTVRGIEAVVSGFLPTSSVGVLKLPRAKRGFFTAASLLKAHGYETEFIYGGMSNFDEMRSFFSGNGFDKFYDEPTFENSAFHGTWGVSDEDLMRKAHDIFVAHGDKPFFSLILTTSNHLPYEFPDGRIELYEQPKQTHLNAIKYADYSLGLFFDLAKKSPYYENTIFIIVGDHNSHVRGNEHVPVDKFHVPALIIGPGVPHEERAMLASQIDLLPTALHFSGLQTEHPMIGRNLMELPPNTPGRAFMQFGSNNAYRIEDDIVIHRPFLPPEQFRYDAGKLVPAPLDPEMAKDALAHTHLPWILYSEEKYTTPVK